MEENTHKLGPLVESGFELEISNDLVFLRFKEGTVLITKLNLAEILQLILDAKLKSGLFLVVEVPGFIGMTREAKEFVTEVTESINAKAIAVVTGHYIQGFGVKVFKRFFNPSFQIRSFKEKSNASKWLRSLHKIN